jgi:hypothetical protein
VGFASKKHFIALYILRFFDLILPKYKTLGASDRAAAMSGVPSSLKSPTAKPYTVPFESPNEIDVKRRPVPSLKNRVDDASTISGKKTEKWKTSVRESERSTISET